MNAGNPYVIRGCTPIAAFTMEQRNSGRKSNETGNRIYGRYWACNALLNSMRLIITDLIN